MRLKIVLAIALLLVAAQLLIQLRRDHASRDHVSGIQPVNTMSCLSPKQYKINDLVVVHVLETANYIGDELNITLPTNDENATSEESAYKISARIVEILPNGNLALEARKSMCFDDELIETLLTGIARPEEILPNDIVLSEKLAELTINRRHSTLVSQNAPWQWLVAAFTP